MNINILWIDDDYKLQEDFISFAEQDGIDIHPFESHEEGMASLEAKPNFYHAAILDAKVKNKKDDTVTGLDGLRASRDRLVEMNKDQYLPFFIFTGQPDYTSNEVFISELSSNPLILNSILSILFLLELIVFTSSEISNFVSNMLLRLFSPISSLRISSIFLSRSPIWKLSSL